MRLAVALISSWAAATMAASVGAQGGVASSPSPAPLPEGNKCEPPTFSFRWVDSSRVKVISKADPPGRFDLVIEDLLKNPKTGAVERRELCDILATTDGTERPVDLQDFRLLDAGGQVRVRFAGKPAEAACPERQNGEATVLALEKHHLSIDVGASFGLDAQGSFKNNPELSINATSRFLPKLSGVVDVRYSSLAPVQQSADVNQFNPFTTGGGTFEATVKVIVPPWGTQWTNPWFALVAGTGVRTVPTSVQPVPSTGASSPSPTSSTSTQPAVNARPRVFGGVRFQVLGYNGGNPAESFSGTRGYFEAGYAQDRFWLVEPGPGVTQAFDERKRWYAEGQLELPGIGGEYVRILARARIDLPTSFKGASEVRISALAGIDPKFFASIFGGVGKITK